jgi:hypothetical protein
MAKRGKYGAEKRQKELKKKKKREEKLEKKKRAKNPEGDPVEGEVTAEAVDGAVEPAEDASTETVDGAPAPAESESAETPGEDAPVDADRNP